MLGVGMVVFSLLLLFGPGWMALVGMFVGIAGLITYLRARYGAWYHHG